MRHKGRKWVQGYLLSAYPLQLLRYDTSFAKLHETLPRTLGTSAAGVVVDGDGEVKW
jgi:hypothetical protein